MPGFGKENTESLAELVWKFFEFWAWAHDFNNAVVSVRTGKFLTKAQKDWTRRIGNERHLICIEVCYTQRLSNSTCKCCMTIKAVLIQSAALE